MCESAGAATRHPVAVQDAAARGAPGPAERAAIEACRNKRVVIVTENAEVQVGVPSCPATGSGWCNAAHRACLRHLDHLASLKARKAAAARKTSLQTSRRRLRVCLEAMSSPLHPAAASCICLQRRTADWCPMCCHCCCLAPCKGCHRRHGDSSGRRTARHPGVAVSFVADRVTSLLPLQSTEPPSILWAIFVPCSWRRRCKPDEV